MTKNTCLSALIGLLSLGMMATSPAIIISADSATFDFLSAGDVAGKTLGGNAFPSPLLRGFDEAQGVFAPAAVSVFGGTIPAGTLLSSHYIFFDPTGSGRISSSVAFDGVILGLTTTAAQVTATQSAYGIGGVTYPTAGGIGLESNDVWSVSGNTLTVDWRASNPGDFVRVFTAARVPDGGAMIALLGGSMLGLAGLKWRMNRKRPV